jgi:hypothetical protein
MVMKLFNLAGTPPLENDHERLTREFDPRHIVAFRWVFTLHQGVSLAGKGFTD